MGLPMGNGHQWGMGKRAPFPDSKYKTFIILNIFTIGKKMKGN
jgi:hypothetical protein